MSEKQVDQILVSITKEDLKAKYMYFELNTESPSKNDLKTYLDSNPGILKISFYNCPGVTELPDLPDSVVEVSIYNCPKLTKLPAIPESVVHLWFVNIPRVTGLPKLPAKLKSLQIENLSGIVELPNLPGTLEVLWVYNCPKLSHLPELPFKMTNLKIQNCPQIKCFKLGNTEVCHTTNPPSGPAEENISAMHQPDYSRLTGLFM